MKRLLLLVTFLMAVSVSLSGQEIREQNPADHHPRVFPMPVRHLVAHSEILGVDMAEAKTTGNGRTSPS